MTDLDNIVAFLDEVLLIKKIPDYPGAHNGLQVENSGRVEKIAVAVDASFGTITDAVEWGADLLVVHHGLFWQGVRAIRGTDYQKMKALMQGDLALYSAHLPLDVHPTLGNNAGLAQALGLEGGQPFFDWKGIQLGLAFDVDEELNSFTKRLPKVLGQAVHVCAAGSEKVGRLGVISGGAGSEVEAVRNAGIDTFLTGEGPHWSQIMAEDLHMNFILGGHYATETFGVKSVGSLLEERFGVPSKFLNRPPQKMSTPLR